MAWSDNTVLRGNTLVNMCTTVKVKDAQELDRIGDWLVVNGFIKKNTAYAVSAYALELLRNTVRAQIGSGGK